MDSDVGEERAKQAAVEYMAAHVLTGKAWPNAYVTGLKRAGAHYIVYLVPESRNRMFMNFFGYRKCWVNANTGVVEKCK